MCWDRIIESEQGEKPEAPLSPVPQPRPERSDRKPVTPAAELPEEAGVEVG